MPDNGGESPPSDEQRAYEDERERQREEREIHKRKRAERLEDADSYELNDSIRIRINSEIKTLWNEAVEKSEYSSISELVRVSVEKELSGRYDSQEQQTEQVLEAVLEVKDEVEETQREVQKARREIVDEDKLNVVLESAMDEVVRGDNDG